MSIKDEGNNCTWIKLVNESTWWMNQSVWNFSDA